MRVQLTVQGDKNGLARSHVSHHGETEHVQRHALRGQRVLHSRLALPATDNHRADSVRVPEPQQSMAANQGYCRISAAAAAVHGVNR